MFEAIEAYGEQIVEFVCDTHTVAASERVLAFGESLAFLSLLIPAWAALVGIGVLIASGGLKFWPIWVAGSSARPWGLAVLLGRRQARALGRAGLALCAVPT